MGEVLFQLERTLRSRQDKLTREEEAVLHTCKANAVREFTISACVASAVVWTGAAALSGIWRFDKSLDSCLDHILALEGSRMQKELANLILTKHRDDPWKMHLINKHFYTEKVFDDSSLDQPLSRWRHRNVFSDNVSRSQRTHNGETCSEKTDLEPKQFSMNPGVDVIADPLECVFGYLGTGEEIHHPDTTGVLPRRRIHGHKRAHRRHRTPHQEVPSSSQHVQI
ncbi:hypothetical protein HHK36_022713 [Tetracentron sinense]|uniref:Uncharacterized protein n=1 Tax=Tetracentron sinense TaxID=13715 RepID=A0A835D725_TETSI|nr:hypothetical protein HHK36_022713 [Tetracentron sinense]